ncbi:hypothetical protein MHBO_002894 [Bonamia ostreae]|uniref:Uncharacterized protein n=1 Tax=Bonamia ostreae TaxID=126728 RepID=A0ABV2APG4_9EUKA
MPSNEENVCCRDLDVVIPSFERDWILIHPYYDMLIRNPEVLPITFIKIMMFKLQHGRIPEHLNNM